MENVNDKIIIYQTDDGNTQIDVRLEHETVWLTQAQMAELFLTDRTSIAELLLFVISTTFTRQKSWNGRQPVQKLHKFKLKEGGKLPELFRISIWI